MQQKQIGQPRWLRSVANTSRLCWAVVGAFVVQGCVTKVLPLVEGGARGC